MRQKDKQQIIHFLTKEGAMEWGILVVGMGLMLI